MKTDLVVEGCVINGGKILLIQHKKLDLWLPVGGHIEQNETPDEALLREIKEETGINVEILNQSDIPLNGNIKKNLKTPFYVNVHSVGDHNHCCFFYLCKALNPEKLQINSESKNFGWFSKDDLDIDHIPDDVRNIGIKALSLYNKLMTNDSKS